MKNFQQVIRHSRESGNLGIQRHGRYPGPPAFALGHAHISVLQVERGPPDSPSPPLGAERVGVRWGSRRSEVRRDPPHPPIASAMGPSLSPRKRAERGERPTIIGTPTEEVCMP
jgi:hypothetical protein